MSNTTKETIWMILTMAAVAVILASTYQWTPWVMGRRITALEGRIAVLEAKRLDHENRISKTERLDAVKVRSLKQMDRDLRAQAEATLAAVRRSERSERFIKGETWKHGLKPVSPYVVYRGGLEQ